MHSSVFKTDLHLEVSAIRNSSFQKLPCRIQVIFVDLTSLIPHSFLIYSVAISKLWRSVDENHGTRPNINSGKTNCILTCSASITETQISAVQFPKRFSKNISWQSILLPLFWRKHLPLTPPCSSQESTFQLTLANVLSLGFSFYPRLIAGLVRRPCNCLHNGQPTCRESHMQVSTSSENKGKKIKRFSCRNCIIEKKNS